MQSDSSCCRIEVDEGLITDAKALLQNSKEALTEQTKLFALLGNEVRLSIVRLFLSFERMCVCDLADVLEMKQSPISQHLRKLKDGGILVSKREGMTIFYSLNSEIKERVSAIIEG